MKNVITLPKACSLLNFSVVLASTLIIVEAKHLLFWSCSQLTVIVHDWLSCTISLTLLLKHQPNPEMEELSIILVLIVIQLIGENGKKLEVEANLGEDQEKTYKSS